MPTAFLISIDKNSLRDIEASLIALDSAHKLYACGIRHVAAKSTLADANIDIGTRQQCNEIIQQNSDLLLKLIDDVVDLSSLRCV